MPFLPVRRMGKRGVNRIPSIVSIYPTDPTNSAARTGPDARIGTAASGGIRDIRPKFALLLATDNRSDRRLLDRVLVTAGLASIQLVSSGREAIDYLAGRGGYGDRCAHPFPQVMMLDLAQTKDHGVEVLDWIANHTGNPLCSVYLLAESFDRSLRRRATDFGVAGLFTKPLSLAQVTCILEDRLALAY
jgi:CheY-like chemotaxis protein